MSQQQYQPQIYPYNNVPIRPNTNIPSQSSSSPSSSSSHSNGSFGPVFLVLAVILVVSVLACIANRLCRRRSNNHHDHMPKNTMKIHGHGHGPTHNHNHNHNHGHRYDHDHGHDPHGDGKLPREWEGKLQSHEKGGDLEMGKRMIASAKVAAANGEEPSTSFMPHDINGGGGKGGSKFAVHHMQFKPAMRSSSGI